MQRYVLRSLVGLIPVLFGISVFIFLIVHLIPGDPVSVMLGRVSDPTVVAAVKAEYGLNKPLVVQYATWLGQVGHGDLGYSISNGEAVAPQIAERIPRTLYLLLGGMLLALLVAVPTGILAAAKHNSWVDLAATTLNLVLMSIPSFWFAIILMLILAVQYRVLPATGYVPPEAGFGDFLRHLVIPCVALAAAEAGMIARLLRSTMLDTLSQNYIVVARAKGTPRRRVLYRHALRNSVVPVVTVVAVEIGYLLGGSIIIEQVFGYPGMGLLLITAITARDYPVIQGTILVYALFFLLINLLTDLLYALLDPRIKYA
jgi:peptide/nickel transport system permease protein